MTTAIAAAARAKAELEQTEAAFDGLIAEAFKAWKLTERADTEGREKLYMFVAGLEQAREALNLTVANGAYETTLADMGLPPS